MDLSVAIWTNLHYMQLSGPICGYLDKPPSPKDTKHETTNTQFKTPNTPPLWGEHGVLDFLNQLPAKFC